MDVRMRSKRMALRNRSANLTHGKPQRLAVSVEVRNQRQAIEDHGLQQGNRRGNSSYLIAHNSGLCEMRIDLDPSVRISLFRQSIFGYISVMQSIETKTACSQTLYVQQFTNTQPPQQPQISFARTTHSQSDTFENPFPMISAQDLVVHGAATSESAIPISISANSYPQLHLLCPPRLPSRLYSPFSTISPISSLFSPPLPPSSSSALLFTDFAIFALSSFPLALLPHSSFSSSTLSHEPHTAPACPDRAPSWLFERLLLTAASGTSSSICCRHRQSRVGARILRAYIKPQMSISQASSFH